jgi:exosortase
MSNGSASITIKPPTLAVDWLKWALCAAIVGLIFVAYGVQTVERARTYDASCYQWLTSHWQTTSNYSHGPLIPLIAVALVWWKRQEIFQQTIHPSTWGPVVVGLAMGVYYFGVKAFQPRFVVLSFVLLLYGLTLALGGRGLFRVLFFPITFLLLMIPLNFLDELVGFPLRMYVAQGSTALLNWFGISAVRVGTAIYSPVFHFDVADPCSGIRSLMALATVTAAYAYVTQTVQWKRWVLFLSAMPLAMLGNLARVTAVAIVAQVYGQDAANKFHDYGSGYIIFGVALSTMVIVGLLLNFKFRLIWENWMKPVEHKEVNE